MPRLPHDGLRAAWRLPKGCSPKRTWRPGPGRVRILSRPRQRPHPAQGREIWHDPEPRRQVRLLCDSTDLRQLPRRSQRPELYFRGPGAHRPAAPRHHRTRHRKTAGPICGGPHGSGPTGPSSALDRPRWLNFQPMKQGAPSLAPAPCRRTSGALCSQNTVRRNP